MRNCACGCGELLNPVDERGRLRKYKNGHSGGRRALIGGSPYLDESFSYSGLHAWLTRNFVKDTCEECSSDDQLEWANISGDYRRDREDYKILCRSCHNKFDQRGFGGYYQDAVGTPA